MLFRQHTAQWLKRASFLFRCSVSESIFPKLGIAICTKNLPSYRPLKWSLTHTYRKVASRSTSWLVALPRIFRLFMKGKYDAYVLWPLDKKVQNWIVDRSTACNFTVLDEAKIDNFLIFMAIHFLFALPMKILKKNQKQDAMAKLHKNSVLSWHPNLPKSRR